MQQINPYDRADDPSRGKIIAVVLLAVTLHIVVGFLGLIILPGLGAIQPNPEPQQEVMVVQLIPDEGPTQTPTAPEATVVSDQEEQEPVVSVVPQDPVQDEPEKIESPTDLIALGLKTPEKLPEIKKNEKRPPKLTAEIDKSETTPKKLAKTLDDEINESIARVKNQVAMRENSSDGEGSELSSLASRGQIIHPEKMEYYTHIRDIVYSNWVLPPETLSADLAATYQIRIEPNGAVSMVGFVESSGNPDYDLSVKRAIDKSSPFLPLPPIFGGLADNPAMQFETDEFKKSKQQ